MKTYKERDKAQLQPACNTQQQLGNEELVPSDKASVLINDLTSRYVNMLVEASTLIARQEKADHEITVDHVEKAIGILKERERRNSKKVLSGIFSGALFGTGLPLLMSVSSFSSISLYQGLLLITFGCVFAKYSDSD